MGGVKITPPRRVTGRKNAGLVRVKAPFGCLISGSSSVSGKTTIVEHIIGHADKNDRTASESYHFFDYAHW